MDFLLFSSSFTLFCFLLGVKECFTYEVPCKHFEVLRCGDENSVWAICTPKTPGVSRILTAQLDTRYRNRYCRKYGTPEHFGLSYSGRSLWTVGWCYGTFFLCLEIDSSYESDEEQDIGLGALSTENDKYNETTTTPGYDPVYSTSGFINASDYDNITDTDYDEGEFTEESDEYIPNEEYFETDMLHAEINSHVDSDPDIVFYGPDPRLKFWLIFGIVGGGVIFVVLISAVAYLTIQCCNDSVKEKASYSKSNAKSSKKYFRPQKWSTSALVTSEHESQSDVYDFIPAAKLKSSASIKIENETREKQLYEQRDKQSNKKNVETYKSYGAGYNATRSHNNDSLKRNDYFILMPKELDSENTSEVVYAHATENIYDHLVHIPTATVPDSSTYHCLNFRRDDPVEESLTETYTEREMTHNEADTDKESDNESEHCSIKKKLDKSKENLYLIRKSSKLSN